MALGRRRDGRFRRRRGAAGADDTHCRSNHAAAPRPIDGAIHLVGQYAIQIDWSDNHTTGIYNFRDLRANCPCEPCAKLRASGKTPE